MTSLSWNYQGYVYQEGVSVLISAYYAAARALHEEWERAKEEASAYQEGVASGERGWIGEMEDGHVLWDQDQVHEMEIKLKLEGQSALRKAFALSTYHHWERGARTWTGNHDRDHEKLVNAVKAMGIEVSPRLVAVKDLANLLKHNNDKRGADLLKSWPELLRNVTRRAENRSDWYGAVRLTDNHLNEAFNIIAASGPHAKTVYVQSA